MAETRKTVRGRNTATDTSNKELLPAIGEGKEYRITSVVISNTSATPSEVHIKSGTTTIHTFPAPADSGCVHRFDPEDPLVCAEGEAVNFAAADSVTTMTVSVVGHVKKRK